MKIHLLIVGGIRSHYIKIAALQYMLTKIDQDLVDCFKFTYVDVGQHYSPTLADDFIAELQISFQYRFSHDTVEANAIYGSILGKLCSLIDEIEKQKRIDYIVVIGDAITTGLSSVAASIKGKDLIHIEAGERHCGGISPEEASRSLADHFATLCFAVTLADLDNLIREKRGKESCFSGDILFDFISRIALKESSSFFYNENGTLKEYHLAEGGYVLTSLHHIENADPVILSSCFYAMHELDVRTIFIAHPRIKRIILENKINTYDTLIVDQIPYLENLIAIKHAKGILTDSGGIQKEAFYLDRRCVVRSEEIVWESLVSKGANMKIGISVDEFRRGFRWLRENGTQVFQYDGEFGNGDAVERILYFILER